MEQLEALPADLVLKAMTHTKNHKNIGSAQVKMYNTVVLLLPKIGSSAEAVFSEQIPIFIQTKLPPRSDKNSYQYTYV